MENENCQICLRHRLLTHLPGGPIFQDEDIFIAHFPLIPTEPAYRGHIILELRRHVTTPAELTESEAIKIGLWTKRIVDVLEKGLEAVHVYVLRIGDLTPHLHFHFVPRFATTPHADWGPLLFRSKDAPRADAKAMVEITECLRNQLKIL
jgi:histidine triad (HIT) family protein